MHVTSLSNRTLPAAPPSAPPRPTSPPPADGFASSAAEAPAVSGKSLAALCASVATDERGAAVRAALHQLTAAGWTLQSGTHPRYRNPRAGIPRFDALDEGQAAALVAAPGPLDALHPPRCLHMVRADGRTQDLIDEEDVLAFQFFEVHGPSHRLQDPGLASRLDDLSRRGYQLSGNCSWDRGTAGAYRSLRSGEGGLARVGSVQVGDLKDPGWSGSAAYEQVLAPAARDGLLSADALDKVLMRLEDIPAPLDESRRIVALADAITAGPERALDAAARTDAALTAWDAMRKTSAVDGDAARLLGHLAAADLAGPLDYLQSVGRGLVASGREERQRVFWHALSSGTAAANLPRLTEMLVRRPAGADLDERIALLDRLVAARGGDATSDVEALGNLGALDCPTYPPLLAAAARRHDDAPAIFSTLCDLARERNWPRDATVEAFMALYLGRPSAPDALRELVGRPDLEGRAAGRVENLGGGLRINGIHVPVRAR